MNTPSNLLTNDNNQSWRWVPLLTPCIKENLCEEDTNLLFKRFNLIVITSIITAVVAPVFMTLSIPLATVLLFSPILFFAVLPLDIWLTNKAIKAKAVNEYLFEPYPSTSATRCLKQDFKAIQSLINKNGNLNKINEEGNRLLDSFPELNIFKLLVDHGTDVKALNSRNISYFQEAVEHENPAYLEYLLKSNKVTADDFNAHEQFELWSKIRSIKSGYLLKQYRFDVNAKDNQGYTPLLKLIKQESGLFSLHRFNQLTAPAHVTTLLNCGADRSITVLDGSNQKNAMQMNTNPVIQRLLEQN